MPTNMETTMPPSVNTGVFKKVLSFFEQERKDAFGSVKPWYSVPTLTRKLQDFYPGESHIFTEESVRSALSHGKQRKVLRVEALDKNQRPWRFGFTVLKRNVKLKNIQFSGETTLVNDGVNVLPETKTAAEKPFDFRKAVAQVIDNPNAPVYLELDNECSEEAFNLIATVAPKLDIGVRFQEAWNFKTGKNDVNKKVLVLFSEV